MSSVKDEFGQGVPDVVELTECLQAENTRLMQTIADLVGDVARLKQCEVNFNFILPVLDAVTFSQGLEGSWQQRLEGLRDLATGKVKGPLKLENERLRAELAEAVPFMAAVKAAHNGYDPAARELGLEFRVPATPTEAITDLLKETDEIARDECKQEIERLTRELMEKETTDAR
jgi:hypothetical protein